MGIQPGSIGEWLKERCFEEKLSLRQAAEKIGISHTTIGLIIKGAHAAPDTIRKLAAAFSGDGEYLCRALEDELLILGGYRTRPPSSQQPSEPLARLMDLVAEFSEPQLKLMLRFAQFLGEIEKKI